MASLRELIIKISANSSSFQSEIARASRMGADYYKTMERGNRQAENATRQSQRALADLNGQLVSVRGSALAMGGALAGAFATGNLISMADKWNSLNARVKLATTSTEDFTIAQAGLMKISQYTGSTFEANASLFSRASSSLREWGYGTQDILKLTDALSTGLQVSGASADETASLITQLSQALGRGVLRGQDFNSVAQSGQRVMKALADGMGVAQKDLKGLADTGKLTTDVIVPALISQLGQLRKEFDTMPNSVSAASTRVMNAFQQWVGGQNDAVGVTATVSAGLDGLAKNIDTVAFALGAMASVGAARFFGGMVSSMGNATTGILKAYRAEVSLAAAQVDGTKVATARARAAVYRAQQALEAARGTDRQSAAERRLEASQARVTRNIAARTAAQAALNNVTSVGSRLMSGALGLVGGIPGLVMMGAGAWYYMHQQQEQARASAEAYVKTLDEVRAKLPTMTLPDISDHKKNAQNSLDEYSKKIKEQTGLVERLERQIVALKETQSAGISGGYTQYMMARNPSKGVPDTSGDVTEKLKQSTEQLATERARLNQIQQEAGSIGLSLEGIERRRVDLIREQAWRDNAAYQSLVMMTGQHTEFNRILGLGNTLLAARQGLLLNAPLRMPQATVTDTEQQSLLQKQQAAELAGLEGIARVRKQAQFDLQKMGKTGPENSAYAAQYTQAMEKEFTETQRLAKAKKDGASATNAHNKAENEAAKTAEQYSRKIADLSIAVEVQKVRANQGEKAADLYAASHENGAKWTNEQRKAIEASAVELATWTQKADEAVRKQREMADALKELTDAARKYRDDATASEKTRGMGQRQRDRFDERQQVERIFDKSDKGSAAVAARNAALDALGMKYKEAKAAEADWMGGVSAGLADWVDEASDYAGQAADATKNAMGGMVNNITDMLNGNKASWKDWSISVLESIEKILVNAAIVNGLKSLGNSMSGAGGMWGSIGGFISGAVANAKGGVYDSPSLSAYSNSVVSSPTYFAFAKGAGLMGEAGPEAIMPLTRAADGSLGVRALTASQPVGSGMGSSGGAPIVNITVYSDGQTTTSAPAGMEQFGSEVGKFVDQRIRVYLQKATGQGGMLTTAIKGGR